MASLLTRARGEITHLHVDHQRIAQCSYSGVKIYATTFSSLITFFNYAIFLYFFFSNNIFSNIIQYYFLLKGFLFSLIITRSKICDVRI